MTSLQTRLSPSYAFVTFYIFLYEVCFAIFSEVLDEYFLGKDFCKIHLLATF